MRLENVNCFLCTTHVAALSNEFDLGLDQTVGLFTGNFVLCRAWQCNVHVTNMQPWTCSADIFEATELVGNFCKLLPLNLKLGNCADFFWRDALCFCCNNGTLAVAERNNCSAEFDAFKGSILRDVARTRDDDLFAFEGFLTARGIIDHVLYVLASVSNKAMRGCGASGNYSRKRDHSL